MNQTIFFREFLVGFCKSTKAKELALNLKFFPDVDALKNEFELLEEIQTIHYDDKLSLPHPNSEDIDGALKLLRVENGVLILDELIINISGPSSSELLINNFSCLGKFRPLLL